MRTVITISLNGNAYQLDAVGYDALRAYLQVAEQRLAGNPDQGEILADLEQAIADKCNRYLGPHKNVVGADEVAEVIREMGPVDGGAEESAAQAGANAGAGRTYTQGEYAEAVGEAWTADGAGVGAASAGMGAGSAGIGTASAGVGTASPGGAAAMGSQAPAGEIPRRLYQIREGSVFSGVCQGLAAYLNIDVSIVRILFIVLAVVTGGVWILVYIVMMFVIPFAETSEQHAAAHGWPFNAEELIARAKTHYQAFTASEKWRRQQSREQRRMWKDQRKQWKQERRAWERAGGYQGVPPPPPPTYSSQVVHSVLTPLVELVGALLFIAFLFALFSIVTKHRVFGWGLPGDVPGWVGILVLIVLYRVIASPLRQARYGVYGPYFGQGLLALFGVLVWLAIVTFVAWLAWQHWAEVQTFFQQLAGSIHDFIEDRRTAHADPVQAGFVAVLPGLPPCLLPVRVRARAGELQSHG
jgi:phage shock protein PspC (stress-responsive transcriptional regulator)